MKLPLAILTLMTAACALAQEPTIYTINNRWLGNKYLHDADGKPAYDDLKTDDAFSWTLETTDGFRRLKNIKTNRYLALDSDNKALTLLPVADAKQNAQWTLDVVDAPWLTLRNRANNNLLNTESKTGFATADLNKNVGPSDFWSCQWKLNHIAGPQGEKFMPRGLISVISPNPGDTVKDSVTIKLSAAGYQTVAASSWKPIGRFGANALLITTTVNADGSAMLTLPLADLPYGPVTITLTAYNGNNKNNYFLQLFNLSGKPWNQGVKNNPVPPAAKDMQLLFADDFDAPLSISRDGKGARYAAHKPGGGDFSNWNLAPFVDPNDTDTPFSQRDTWLRLRTDTNKKAAGLLSSIAFDGTGITATLPCYFDCRFIAHSAPGTWPAFWVMTTGVRNGLNVPADELDVIEAYGGEGPKSPNAPGYMIASHTWNQKDQPKQDGFYGPIHMRKLPAGGGASWYETPHTYGVYIDEENTIYYCDDIEVARHKTTRVCKQEPLFYFINNAVSSDWPANLSQYNGIADMYVDFVRVYQGKK